MDVEQEAEQKPSTASTVEPQSAGLGSSDGDLDEDVDSGEALYEP